MMKNLCLVLASLAVVSCSLPESVEQTRAPISHPGDEFRAELGLKLPNSDTMVILFGVSTHHTRDEWSVVAWRSADGAWTVERAGRVSGNMFRMEARIYPLERKVLSDQEARQLEQLIADPTLYREAAQHGDPPIGGFQSTMEIVTPKRRRVVGWHGRLSGRLGEVADIVLRRR